MKVRRKKIVLRSKTLPWSLTATPHPILPPIPAARHLARRLHPLTSPYPLPFPSPSYPSAFYLSTNPLYLPLYQAAYLILYLPSTYPSTYLPPSSLPPSPCPPPGPPPGRCTNSRFPYPSQGLFSSLSSPQALLNPSRAFFLFFLFYANQAGLEPVTSLFAN